MRFVEEEVRVGWVRVSDNMVIRLLGLSFLRL